MADIDATVESSFTTADDFDDVNINRDIVLADALSVNSVLGDSIGVVGDASSVQAIVGAEVVKRATANLTLPAFVIDFYIGPHGQTDDEHMQLPMLEVEGTSGFTNNYTFPSFEVAGTGLTGIISTGSEITLPLLTVDSRSGATASFSIPKMTVVSVGTVGTRGNASVTFPRFTNNGAGTVQTVANGAVTFKALTVSGHGWVSIVGNSSLDIPSWVVEGVGLTGILGTSVNSFPVITVSATGLVPLVGTFAESLPSFVVYSEGINPVTLVEYEYETACIVMNLINKGLSKYTNWDFNGIAVLNGRLFMCGATGVFEHIGDNDNGETIDSEIELPLYDLDIPSRKRLASVIVSGDLEGTLDVTPDVDGTPGNVYPIRTYGTRGKMAGGRALTAGSEDGLFVSAKITNAAGEYFRVTGVDFSLQVKNTVGSYTWISGRGKMTLPSLVCNG